MSSLPQDPTTVQPQGPLYRSRKQSIGGILQQPQGARPKTTSLMKNARQVRALPAVPPSPSSPGAHLLYTPQSARGMRPLPLCPSSSSLKSQSSLPPSPPPPPPPPPSTLSTPSSSTATPIIASEEVDDSSCDMGPIEFSPMERSESDSTSDEDEDELEAADIVDTISRVEFKGFIGHSWMLDDKAVPRRPNSITKKWMTENKGNRATVKDYDNVMHMLRTL